ncbi:MAG: DUF5317 family protein [Actinomycetota bacterium]
MLGPLIAFALGLGVSLAVGGSLRRLAGTRFRALPLLLASLVVPAGVVSTGQELRPYAVALVVASNIILVVFAVANRRIPGLALVAAGVLLNALVITVNGAMPVQASSAGDVASTQTVGSIKHEPLTNETLLPWLADRIPVDLTDQVWSVGDLLLVSGVAVMGFGLTRRPSRPAMRGRSSRAAA